MFDIDGWSAYSAITIFAWILFCLHTFCLSEEILMAATPNRWFDQLLPSQYFLFFCRSVHHSFIPIIPSASDSIVTPFPRVLFWRGAVNARGTSDLFHVLNRGAEKDRSLTVSAFLWLARASRAGVVYLIEIDLICV